MRVTVGSGKTRVSMPVLSGSNKTLDKAQRIRRDMDAEDVKSFLFRPAMLSRAA